MVDYGFTNVIYHGSLLILYLPNLPFDPPLVPLNMMFYLRIEVFLPFFRYLVGLYRCNHTKKCGNIKQHIFHELGEGLSLFNIYIYKYKCNTRSRISQHLTPSEISQAWSDIPFLSYAYSMIIHTKPCKNNIKPLKPIIKPKCWDISNIDGIVLTIGTKSHNSPNRDSTNGYSIWWHYPYWDYPVS